MAQAVLWQAVTILVVAALAAALGGGQAALSAGLGGLACLVPNALFAWRLSIEAKRPGGATVHGFFIGEFTKLVLTVCLLFAIGRLVHDLNWLALIVGFIAALKSYLLMFLFGRVRA